MSTMITRRALAAAMALPALPSLARAQAFPSRPLRMICPFAAGGSADASARMLAAPLSEARSRKVLPIWPWNG